MNAFQKQLLLKDRSMAELSNPDRDGIGQPLPPAKVSVEDFLNEQPPCTTGCVINSHVGGDHAYCTCHCHVGTLPAIPPSRERKLLTTKDSHQ